MNTSFFVNNRRCDKNGESPIRLSVTARGVRFETAVPCKIAPEKWDARRQQAKKGSVNRAGMAFNDINAMLARISEVYAEYFTECVRDNVAPSAVAMKALWQEKFVANTAKKTAGTKTFLTYWDEYSREMTENGQWTRSTLYKYRSIRLHIAEYKPVVTFNDFTEEGFGKYIAYLRDVRGVRNTTIGKEIKFIKSVLRWAVTKGYCKDESFENFKPKLRNTQRKVVFLDWDELMLVNSCEIPKNGTTMALRDENGKLYYKMVHDAAGWEKSRDIFCFCCFTSLRYSDAQNLRWADVHGDTFTITTVKTADTIVIDINKYARAILEKYKGVCIDGHVFPRITNQRMNEYIKEVCELCGINELVTQTHYRGAERIDETLPKFKHIGTHAGRRTFICNALMLGIPAEIVMKWTGHSDYKTMKPYIDVTNDAKAKAMSLFDKR